jgi:hypothetical protein
MRIYLDEVANLLWDSVIKPTYQHFLEIILQQAALHSAESAGT